MEKTSDFPPANRALRRRSFFTMVWRAFFTLDISGILGIVARKSAYPCKRESRSGIAGIQIRERGEFAGEYTLETIDQGTGRGHQRLAFRIRPDRACHCQDQGRRL